MYKLIIYILLTICIINQVFAEDTKFILHDKCINALYKPAVLYFEYTDITVFRDSRGIILRFEIKNLQDERKHLSATTLTNISRIKDFLAKIKNPVIIEVHTAKNKSADINSEKNWEISAVIAGNIEHVLCDKDISNSRIHSVGYGEFLPENNTPNNGGKLLNRVDIIILCNISGE